MLLHLKDAENILNKIHKEFAEKNEIRDKCLILCREIIRNCGFAIKHIHRYEKKDAIRLLKKIQKNINYLNSVFSKFPSVYFSGYVLDAQKEYCEAKIFYSIIYDENIPSPYEMKVESSAYLQGMGETIGELRRYILNCIKEDRINIAEKYFNIMDEIYYLLFGFDYPSGITGELRRITDTARNILEKTHGDLTIAISQNKLIRLLEGCKR